jgi:Rod binding domain-containing protein
MIETPPIVDQTALPSRGASLAEVGGVRTRSFVGALQEASEIEDPAERAKAEARATAEEFVAVALVQPLLAQLRESNNAWGPFAPGAHEKQFGAMLDAEYASRIARASGYGLVDRLSNDLLKHVPTLEVDA